MKEVLALLLLSLCCCLSRGLGDNRDSEGYQGTGASLAVCLPDTCALFRELAAMKERLGTMDQTQAALKESFGAMGQKLGAVETKLQGSESQVEELKKVNTAQPKVAFSVALRDSGSGNIGPFTTNTPLQYKRVFSNTGSSYNPATGIFTAMVRGMYCFRYSMYSNNSGRPNSVVSLMKNSEKLVTTWNTDDSMNVHESASNAAVVQLEVGDSVYIQLWANRVVYDDINNYNTFTGFLLFTV
uniref:Complement C1q-like protein 2 n=1 Tax=Salmo trutta TaxID=8032 RepID=A0A673XJ66_SALTR